MSDYDRFDELMRLALHDARTIEPTEHEIAAAVRAANAPAPRKLRGRRLVAVAAAALALVTGTAFAVPQTRHALTDGFGRLEDFLTTGADAPGTPIPAGENDGNLDWFRGTDTTNGSIIAQTESGTARRVPTNRPPGWRASPYGTIVSACRPDKEWTQLLKSSPVLLTGPFPEPDPTGRLALFGIAADNITTIKLDYADGTTEHAEGVEHGFVLFADPKRRPAKLTAQDQAGNTIATIDVSHLQWEFHH